MDGDIRVEPVDGEVLGRGRKNQEEVKAEDDKDKESKMREYLKTLHESPPHMVQSLGISMGLEFRIPKSAIRNPKN